MHFILKLLSSNFLSNFLLCSISLAIISAIAVSKDVTENWIPSDEFSNASAINWYTRKLDEDVKAIKSPFARNFPNDDTTSIDRAFNDYVNYNNDFNERDDFKAIPFQVPELISVSSGGGGSSSTGASNNNALHFHSTFFQPQPQLQSNSAKPFYAPANVPSVVSQISSSSTSSPYPTNPAAAVAISSFVPHSHSSPSASYNSNTYPSYQVHSQNLENFDYLPPAPYPSRFTDNTANIALNTRHLLYLQPGKCSNSIEVGRLRDIEIKSAVKTITADSQKSVCVLMLYAANENNKLAISMQSTLETATAELETENWLERSIKVYSLQGGTIARTPIDANFGVGSPALILTKSSIVLLSIVADRTLDFQIDISTYQSNSC